MPLPRMRFLAIGVVAAGLIAAGWLNAAEPPAAGPKGDSVPAQAGDTNEPADKTGKDDSVVRVDAPGTKVTVDKATGEVSVTAPHTEVQVDADKGRVRVRAPYVNLDIRW